MGDNIKNQEDMSKEEKELTKVKYWRHFALCHECYNDKKHKDGENTPDLEDLERFKVGI